MKEVGRATSHLFKKNDSKTRDARLRSAFNATQRTGIHKKECTKLSVNRQDKNKCTGNYCCRIEQCIRYSGLCLRRRRGCHGRRLFFFFPKAALLFRFAVINRLPSASSSLCSLTCLCSVDTNSRTSVHSNSPTNTAVIRTATNVISLTG